MTRDEHLAKIYYLGAKMIGKRRGLAFLCSNLDCAGSQIFAPGITTADILEAVNDHMDEMERLAALPRQHMIDPLAQILEWAADEIDAQAAAHNVKEPQMIDLTDHIRCFGDQPDRRSITPWPEAVRRPGISKAR